ncbi:outer membrane protein assembly factor BamA [Steroidobacter sp. S1-65]|uniref:Outer membrane protein assembly factor BamA n=1 Tax=Steroidobacter gossypii TaxID=2805490 RepID=A0ABS1WVR7_9GAMM|nr:outer membrane protein assembly factor BamA [Steroidobacter gossypii]MBM0105071.1 outer membrane protein assembly factor BamA [Steroidobacter gossypii]
MKSIIHATLAVAAAGALPGVWQGVAVAQGATESSFTVGDIRIEGLQRISEGTVYNYLPVNIGDRIDQRRVQEALRAMYSTGFFRDVEIRREGGTLIVAVLERPSIESFEIKGNKDIKTEDLQKSLRNVGLATGKTFDQSVLDEVKQYLTDQYFSRGKYAVRVDTKVEEVPGNKVKLTIDVNEGKRARIRQINVAGNTAFSDEELREEFELNTPNWLSWYKQDDRYSRESLSGDLEKLRSYYMDRGYANFAVTSTQVAIAPEKDDIFVTVNVEEGDVFKISEIKMAGNMVVPESELRRLIFFKPGDTYSLRSITASQEAMKLRLGVDGYAFATVDPVPTPNKDTKEISLTFVVDPKNRVYVRRVNFNGTSGVNDEVFRREMRQFEGSYLSNAAVERSKQRIQRLPFIQKVEVETNQVPGAADLVDVDFEIEEGLPGQFGGGVGYSESQSIILNGNFVHSNFMGTGNRVAMEINSGRYAKAFTFSHTDRYTTIDEVQRTFSLGYRDVTQFTSATSDFDTETITLGINYDWPITEYQYLGVGLTAQRAELVTSEGGSAEQATEWVRSNGNARTRCVDYFNNNGVCEPSLGEYFLYSSEFDTLELNLGWRYDSRNRAIFADRGARHRFNIGYTVPGSDVEYWTASYDFLQFVPIWRSFTLMFNVELAYGEALGDTTALPPYRQYFGGGPDSVRGFRESRLGPQDNFGRPYGGNIKTIAQTELLLPMPEKWRNSARFSLFYDIGNVFSNQDVQFFGPPDPETGIRQPVEYHFSYDELRHSAGVAVQWLAPLGVFRFSYAVPLKKMSGDTAGRYGDETEGFQFSIGQAF